MDSKLCLLATIFSSWIFVVYSQGDGPPPSYPCIQDLLPCQPYISGATPPLPSCCVPLKGVVKDQKDCLCALFNNQGFLQTMNITQEKALTLPKACGIKVDTNICKTLVHGNLSATFPCAISYIRCQFVGNVIMI